MYLQLKAVLELLYSTFILLFLCYLYVEVVICSVKKELMEYSDTVHLSRHIEKKERLECTQQRHRSACISLQLWS